MTIAPQQTPNLRQIQPADLADPARLLALLNGYFSAATNTALARPRTVTREITVRAPARWIDATLVNAWGNVTGHDPVGYWMDATGRVWLRGACSLGTYGPLPIFTLPAAYAPTQPQPLAVLQSSAAWPQGRVDVLANGDVVAFPLTSVQSGVSAFLSFVGASFEAAGPVPVAPGSPFPIAVDTSGLEASPTSLIVLDCEDVTTGTPLATPVTAAWDLALVGGVPRVRLTQLHGLAPGRLYRVRVEIGTR